MHCRKYFELVGINDSAEQLDSSFLEECDTPLDVRVLHAGITKSARLFDPVQSGGASPGLADWRLPR